MIGVITRWFLGTRLGRLSVGLLSAIMILWATYVAGKRDARSEARTEALEGYVKTKEKIDEVDAPTDRDGAAEWLRDHGHVRKGDL